MRRDLDRIEDMLSSAADVMEFAGGLTRQDFDSQKAIRFAILHALTVIGEAANGVSEHLRLQHSEIPWRKVIAFRNRLVHGYSDLDLDLIWDVTTRLVPALHLQLKELYGNLGTDAINSDPGPRA